jgi:hypothetical protein
MQSHKPYNKVILNPIFKICFNLGKVVGRSFMTKACNPINILFSPPLVLALILVYITSNKWLVGLIARLLKPSNANEVSSIGMISEANGAKLRVRSSTRSLLSHAS